jgi:hypothetical protein
VDCKGESGGGVLPLILTFLFLAVLTPIGEKFLFRVVANALLRYGPVVGQLSDLRAVPRHHAP